MAGPNRKETENVAPTATPLVENKPQVKQPASNSTQTTTPEQNTPVVEDNRA